MNAIAEGLKYIKRLIPKDVIKYAYEQTYPKYLTRMNISIDEFIKTKIIKEIVVNDYAIIGAIEENIPLGGLPYEQVETGDQGLVSYVNPLVFRIPKSMTQGRSIVAVNHLGTMPSNSPYNVQSMPGTGSGYSCDTNALTAGARQIVNNALGANNTYLNTNVTLLVENTVMIEATQVMPYNACLNCILAPDEILSHLRQTGILIFRDVCLYAAQSYIHTHCNVEIDEGELRQGVNVGKIKDTIESYADSWQVYDELFKTKFMRVAFMGDRNRYRNWLRGVGTVYVP